MKLKLLGIVVVLAIAIQFVPYGKDHSNPAVIAEPQWDSPKTRELFMRTCGDCHSNETKWPVYSNVAPASWLVQADVEEARGNFNVSVWGIQKRNKGKDAAEELMAGDMPPRLYVLSHKSAKLSVQEKNELITGLTSTFGTESEDRENEDNDND